MSGKNPALYCALTLIAMQGQHTKQGQKKHDEPDYNSVILGLGSDGWVLMKEIY